MLAGFAIWWSAAFLAVDARGTCFLGRCFQSAEASSFFGCGMGRDGGFDVF